jgi:hypothetical protein
MNDKIKKAIRTKVVHVHQLPLQKLNELKRRGFVVIFQKASA